MCGIVGYIGQREAVKVLLDGLGRLEYRGYDSAGVAVVNGQGVSICRAAGKLQALKDQLGKEGIHGKIGLGHTRWATHGLPTELNAHPHRAGDVVLIHNGILENYRELRASLGKKGATFVSETDTEVFCHLFNHCLRQTDSMEKALQLGLQQVRGSYALAILHLKEPGRLYVARESSPLVIGYGSGEHFIASDVTAFLSYTKEVSYLEDGEWGVITADGVSVFGRNAEPVSKKIETIAWDSSQAEKGGYKHCMLKEICEQSHSVGDTLRGRLNFESQQIALEKEIGNLTGFFSSLQQIQIVACGTSWHAGQVARYWMERQTHVPVQIDLASEYRYRSPLVNDRTLVIAISQSGETADTLAAASLAKEKGARLLAVCNVVGSSLTRLAEATLHTHAGPEIGVASTKAFVTQLAVLYLLSLYIGEKRGVLEPTFVANKVDQLRLLPQQIEHLLRQKKKIAEIAHLYNRSSHFLYIARGEQYPVALEGALKLKEISYLHAEGFAAGELKHGPIALVEPGVPVITLAPHGETYEKTLSNIEEVRARGGLIIALGDEGDRNLAAQANHFISIPKTDPDISPILYIIPLQLFAYYIADFQGRDIDQPRNLAKSVTVE